MDEVAVPARFGHMLYVNESYGLQGVVYDHIVQIDDPEDVRQIRDALTVWLDERAR